MDKRKSAIDYQKKYRSNQDRVRFDTYISKACKENLQSLAEKLNISEKEVMERAVSYFAQDAKNVQNSNKDNSPKRISAKEKQALSSLPERYSQDGLSRIAEKYTKVELLKLYLKNKYWLERLQEVNDELTNTTPL